MIHMGITSHRIDLEEYCRQVRKLLQYGATSEELLSLAETAESFANYLSDLAQTAREKANDLRVGEGGKRVQSS